MLLRACIVVRQERDYIMFCMREDNEAFGGFKGGEIGVLIQQSLRQEINLSLYILPHPAVVMLEVFAGVMVVTISSSNSSSISSINRCSISSSGSSSISSSNGSIINSNGRSIR